MAAATGDRESWEDERARLREALGTDDAQMIIDMVKSLEAQLVDLYRDLDDTVGEE